MSMIKRKTKLKVYVLVILLSIFLMGCDTSNVTYESSEPSSSECFTGDVTVESTEADIIESTDVLQEETEANLIVSEEEMAEIAEMLHIWGTNLYVSTDKNIFVPGEHDFSLYADDSLWFGRDTIRYYVRIQQENTYLGGIKDAVYFVWRGEGENWQITETGTFRARNEQLIGSGTFFIEDTDIAIYENYPLKEKRIIDLLKISMERMFRFSDFYTGEKEVYVYTDNFTKYDDSFPIWCGGDEDYLLSVFYTGVFGEELWDISGRQGWKTKEELDEEGYYIRMTGNLNGEISDVISVEQDDLDQFFGSTLGYLLEKQWKETGSVSGDLCGALYYFPDDQEGDDDIAQILLITEENRQMVMLVDNDTVDKKGLSLVSEMGNIESSDYDQDDAQAWLSFNLRITVDD